jgi:hypothetical protein
MSKPTIVLMIVILMGSVFGTLPIVAAKVIALEHGFAKAIGTIGGRHPLQWDGTVYWKEWIPVNRTSSFSQDDDLVYAYTYANFTGTSTTYANLTWVWYNPGGAIYSNQHRTVACWGNYIPFIYCQYYSTISVRGRNAARLFGTWRMDFYADGALLYSDSFVIKPVVTEQDSFDINLRNPTVTVVNATIIIHPENSSWSEYVMAYTPSHSHNFTAFDPERNRGLQLQFNRISSSVVVDLGGARHDGYKLNIGFSFSRNAISRTKNNYTFTWRFYNGVHPIPQNFTITLPSGYSILGQIGIANYTEKLIGGRRSVSFNITTMPDDMMQWSLTYGQISPQITTTTQATHVTQLAQPVQMILSGVPAIVLSGTTVNLQGTARLNATRSGNVTIYVDGAMYANASIHRNSFTLPVVIPFFMSPGEHNVTAIYQSTVPSVPAAKNTLMIFVINTPYLVFSVASISGVSVIWLMQRSRRKKLERKAGTEPKGPMATRRCTSSPSQERCSPLARRKLLRCLRLGLLISNHRMDLSSLRHPAPSLLE